jgi:hypothetical protein
MDHARHVFACFATVATLGCNAGLCDFPQYAGYCDQHIGLEIVKPSDTVDRVQATATLRVRVAAGDLSPRETQFRVWVEGGGVAQGSEPQLGPMLLGGGPVAIELGPVLPRPDAFSCGPATLYLHAGRTDTPLTVPGLTPAGDPDSQLFLEHGRADLQVVDFRPPLSQLSAQKAFNIVTSYTEYSGIVLRGSTSAGYTLISNKVLANSVPNTGIAIAFTSPNTEISSEQTFNQFVGDFSSSGTAMPPDRSLILRSDANGNSDVFSCPLLNKLPLPSENPQDPMQGCRAAVAPNDKLGLDLKFRSLAMDSRGSYFAVVSNTGQLSVYSWEDANLAAKKLSIPQISGNSYTQVIIARVNADELMDIIAMRDNIEPLVLLRNANELTFREDLATEKSLADKVPPALSLRNTSTRIAMGNIRCAPRGILMLGNQSQMAILIPDDTVGSTAYRASAYTLPSPFGTSAIQAMQLLDLAGSAPGTAPDGFVDTLAVLQAGDKVGVYGLIAQ